LRLGIGLDRSEPHMNNVRNHPAQIHWFCLRRFPDFSDGGFEDSGRFGRDRRLFHGAAKQELDTCRKHHAKFPDRGLVAGLNAANQLRQTFIA
jgi:hypothetical protein